MSWSEPQLLRVLVYPVFLSDNTVSSVDPASNWQESPPPHHHAQAFLLADLLNLFVVGSGWEASSKNWRKEARGSWGMQASRNQTGDQQPSIWGSWNWNGCFIPWQGLRFCYLIQACRGWDSYVSLWWSRSWWWFSQTWWLWRLK